MARVDLRRHVLFWLGGMAGGEDKFYEELVDAAVGREFRVEGCRHCLALANEDGEALAFDEDFDFWARRDDPRGADEDGLERAAGQGRVEGEDGGIALGSVGVAFDSDIEGAEAGLGRVANFPGQENGAGAGAEDRFLLRKRP